MSGLAGLFGRRRGVGPDGHLRLRRRRAPVRVTFAALAAALLTACGSSGTHPPSSASGTPSSASSSTSANAATGTPLVFGMYNEESGSLGTFTEFREAAQAAVAYLNQELDGIDGHPIHLVTCATDGTAQASIACAHQLLDAHPVAVFGGADFPAAAALGLYAAAHVPIIGGAAFSPPEQADPDSVRFVGFTLGAFPGLAAWAVDGLHAKRVAVVYPTEQDAVIGVRADVLPVLAKKGVSGSAVTVVQGPAAPPDWATLMASALSGHPDVIIAIANPSFCVPMMQGHASVASTVKLLVPDACADPRVLSAVGAGASNVQFVAQFLANPSNPDVATFLAKLHQYGSASIPIDDFSQAGFNEVMNFWALFHTTGPSGLTGPAILAKFKAQRNAPNFMAHPYSCTGNVVPGAPAICNAATRIITVSNGTVVDVDGWVDGSALVSPPPPGT